MNAYIGVTGFIKKEEVEFALENFPVDFSHQLMVGVHVSEKSLKGIPLKPKWQKQTPQLEDVSKLFLSDARCFNLVHYSAEQNDNSGLLFENLYSVYSLMNDNFHGLQLNIPWPAPDILEDYLWAISGHVQIKLILQVGEKAFNQSGGTYSGMVQFLKKYTGLINGILIDFSGGHGKLLDVKQADELVDATYQALPELSMIGVAGGLGSETIEIIKPLIDKYPYLSIDAQGRLRDEQNNLSSENVKVYLCKAVELFSESQSAWKKSLS